MVSHHGTDPAESAAEAADQPPPPAAAVAIVGGGIVGLVLALGLREKLGVTAEIYEQAGRFADDVGAGMGMYPNGLRVIRDVSRSVFEEIRSAGHPYLYRRWERHDGTAVATAEEGVLSHRDEELQPIGIRRWRLQKVLYDAVVAAGIPVHFHKRTTSVASRPDGSVEIRFDDGTHRLCEVLFGADGSRSEVRRAVAPQARLCYTGVTCVMGISETPREERGICLPTSPTTKCHGAFFPTGENEQCFQFHFPVVPEEADAGNWGILSQKVAADECRKLAERLVEDGWDDKYIAPIRSASNAVKIGFCLLEEPLPTFVYGNHRRIVLLGDAAHPPVPFLGQGAQMGLEDAGVIVSLLQKLCVGVQENGDGGDCATTGSSASFHTANFGNAMKIYDKMRVGRTRDIVYRSWRAGEMQQKRSENEKYNKVKEELLQRSVFFHETLEDLCPGATYDFQKHLEQVLESEPVLLPVLEEEEE
jgi:salicylate hydroxylase